MTRHHLLDTVLIIALVAVAFISSTWGINAAPREYSLLAILCSGMAILLIFKMRRERERE